MLTATAPAWTVERTDGCVLVTTAGVEPASPGWRGCMAQVLRDLPVVAAGARRVASDGAILSMGEFIVHPKGLHHLGRGVAAEGYRFPEEVDAHAGGAIAVRGDAFDAVGGDAWLDPERGPTGLLELGLALRREGGRIVTLPEVTVVDDDPRRPDPADAATRAAFRDRWGFDVLAADLDAVRVRHAGTGLLWNTRVHGRPLPFEKYDRRGAMHWEAYRDAEPYRRRADHLAGLIQGLRPAGPVLDLGCGDGLFTHLLAGGGLETIGLDPEPAAIGQAEAAVAALSYPATRPRFTAGRGEAIPAADGTLAVVAMLDVIEHLPNPAAVLAECRRVLAPGGRLVIATPAWQYGAWSDPVYHVAEYSDRELADQLAATGFAIEASGRIGGVYRDIVVVATRR